ncbi:MAG: DUF4124 domain-containing protein [Deltaproteobacteria bacterium]|nr:DUF4124 domain-containing protein [Deltaproteobacteria bacterium]
MRTLIVIVALTVLFAGYAKADLYHWKDKNGVVHITDSPDKVPEEYRGKMKTRKTPPPPTSQSVETNAPEAARDAQAPPSEELYGDHPLEWWRDALVMNKNELSGLEATIAEKKQFSAKFMEQKRIKLVYDQNDLETYDRYLTEIPSDEAQLVRLKEQRTELLRKATNAGVPRDVRGE